MIGIKDEPAAWAAIPEAKRPRVMAAAKAMCRLQDEGDDNPDYCSGCSEAPEGAKRHGGSCVAFGLYGELAIAAVDALDAAPTT